MSSLNHLYQKTEGQALNSDIYLTVVIVLISFKREEKTFLGK